MKDTDHETCQMIDGKKRGPKDHWTLKTGYFEDPTPAIQVQTLPLEGPRSLGCQALFQNLNEGYTWIKATRIPLQD